MSLATKVWVDTFVQWIRPRASGLIASVKAMTDVDDLARSGEELKKRACLLNSNEPFLSH